MNQVIIKVSEKGNKGEVVKGTGAGYIYPEFTANKFSKEFVLKSDSWAGKTIINAKKGDKVCIAYA